MSIYEKVEAERDMLRDKYEKVEAERDMLRDKLARIAELIKQPHGAGQSSTFLLIEKIINGK